MNCCAFHFTMSYGRSLEVAIVFLSVSMLPEPCSVIRSMVGLNLCGLQLSLFFKEELERISFCLRCIYF